MSAIGGIKLTTDRLVSYYDMGKVTGGTIPDKLGSNTLTGLQNFSESNVGSTGLRSWTKFLNTVIDFQEIVPTTFSILLSFRAESVDGTTSILGETDFMSLRIINGTLNFRVMKSGEAVVPTVSKSGIIPNKWYTVQLTVGTAGGKIQMFVDSPFSPVEAFLPYDLEHSIGDCVLGAGNLNSTDYFAGDMSSIAVYTGVVYPDSNTFTSYGTSVRSQLSAPATLTPSVTLSSGPAWDIENLLLAYDFTDSSAVTGNTINNLASSNTNATMTLNGSPSVVDNKWLYLTPGTSAEGNYTTFTNLFPNVANGTNTTDFTIFTIFTNPDSSFKLGGFDFGYDVSFSVGYQSSVGGNITNKLHDGTGTYFIYRADHSYWTGDGVTYNNAEQDNFYVNKVGLQGYRFTYQGTGTSYLVEWLVDGKPASGWNPPSSVVTSAVRNIDWTWHPSAWAHRKPVFNGATTTGTPSSGTSNIKLGGMFMYNRAITDQELAAIYQQFSL